MNNTKDIHRELKELKSSLANRESKHTFDNNELYFEDLTTQIMNQTKSIPQLQVNHISKIARSKYFRLAAMITVVTVSVFLVYKFDVQKKSKDLYSYESIIEQIDEDIIIEYITENMFDSDMNTEKYIIEELINEKL